MEPIDFENTISLVIRLLINLVILFTIIFLAFNPSAKKKTLIFTLVLFNIIIFLLTTLLNNAYLSMGSGIGLFALFTMLRYRSETLKLKELTYLFILIAIGFINAVGDSISYLELIIMNGTVTTTIICLEKSGICRSLNTKKIKYDNLELIKPEFRNLLLFDIYNKTGIQPASVEIDSINFSDNTATIILFFNESEIPKNNNRPKPIQKIPLEKYRNTKKNPPRTTMRTIGYNLSEKRS